MTIRFQNLSVTHGAERQELLAAIESVLLHGQLILGPEVENFERACAAFLGVAHAVGVGSGSDALFVALKALDVGPGDEVITSPMSFVATANAIRLCGAVPVFADVEEDGNLDPTSVESQITSRTKVLLPVHLNGQMSRMEDLLSIARPRHLRVLEDVAQSFGARGPGGMAGAVGDIAAVSFNPMKPLAALGDAGLVATPSVALAERVRTLRYNGMKERTSCMEASLNGRIDTVQAAVLSVRLGHFREALALRQKIARRYNAGLSAVVMVPPVPDPEACTYYTYTIRTPHRDALMAHLCAAGIEARIRPIGGIIPDHPAYRGARGMVEKARRQAAEALSLPMHTGLTDQEIDEVIVTVQKFFA